MRFRRIASVCALALAGVASACGSGSLQHDQHDGGGDQDGRPGCQSLAEADCRARTDCAVGACAQCSGGQVFAGCYDPASQSPPACLAIPCPPSCATLDETSCRARTDCQVNSCSLCGGAGTYFASCGVAGAPTVACPALTCPASCANFTDQAACDGSGICHSVFTDPGNCRCATTGCCARFSACADGAKATCAPPQILCKSLAPYCEAPYVLSYTTSCYEGCVAPSECGL